jgi:hypothetical protein
VRLLTTGPIEVCVTGSTEPVEARRVEDEPHGIVSRHAMYTNDPRDLPEIYYRVEGVNAPLMESDLVPAPTEPEPGGAVTP